MSRTTVTQLRNIVEQLNDEFDTEQLALSSWSNGERNVYYLVVIDPETHGEFKVNNEGKYASEMKAYLQGIKEYPRIPDYLD